MNLRRLEIYEMQNNSTLGICSVMMGLYSRQENLEYKGCSDPILITLNNLILAKNNYNDKKNLIIFNFRQSHS